MADIQLTAGFVVPRLFDENTNRDLLPPSNDDEHDEWQGPIVQICSIKRIEHEGQRRYRLIVSDGELFTQMMLFASANHLVEDGDVRLDCVVRLDKFSLWGDEARTKRMVVITALTVLAHPERRIGTPKVLTMEGYSAASSRAGTPAKRPAAQSLPPSSPSPAPRASQATPRKSAASASAARRAEPVTPLSVSASASASSSQSRPSPAATPSRSHAVLNPIPSRSSSAPNARNAPAPTAPSQTQAQAQPQTQTQAQTQARIQTRTQTQTQTQRTAHPIAALNPYTGVVTIRVRVVHKSELRTFHRARPSFSSGSEGKVLTLLLADASPVNNGSGGNANIKATAWDADAERVDGIVSRGGVYWVTDFRVQKAKEWRREGQGQGRGAGGGEEEQKYEIVLAKVTKVEQIEEAPGLAYTVEFAEIWDVREKKVQKDADCNVIGVVTHVEDAVEISIKGRKVAKRELTITDKTGSVRVTMWGKNAQDFKLPAPTETSGDEAHCTVVSFLDIRVKEFGDAYTLSVTGATTTKINPPIPEADALREWYLYEVPLSQPFLSQLSQSQHPLSSSQGQTAQAPGGRWLLNDVQHAELGLSSPSSSSDRFVVAGSQGVTFTTQATVVYVPGFNSRAGKEEDEDAPPSLVYPACAAEGCRRKVVWVSQDVEGRGRGEGEGGAYWWCEKCTKRFVQPVWRYVLSLGVADMSGSARVSGFDEAGKAVFGVEAGELVRMKAKDWDAYQKTLAKPVGKVLEITCRAKEEMFNNTPRAKYGVQKATEVDYAKEARYLKELLSSSWAR